MDSENLLALKDDMIAFIEGHGMRHFPAVIPPETPRIWWNDSAAALHRTGPAKETQESWKDFVEMAKALGAPMVCIGEDVLDKTTLEVLSSGLQELSDEDTFGPEMEKLDKLYRYIGKLGHIELAFAYQGILFIHESATGWYQEYREMVDSLEDVQAILEEPYDGPDGEEV